MPPVLPIVIDKPEKLIFVMAINQAQLDPFIDFAEKHFTSQAGTLS